MTKSIVMSVVMGLLLGAALPANAQTTRTESVEQDKSAKAAEVAPPTRETGDILITKLDHLFMPEPPAVRLNFGDFRPGAGFAMGATYVAPVGERGLWSAGGALSVQHFKEVETRLDVPPWSTDRVKVIGTARWEDAPDLRFFGLGMDAPQSGEVTYALRSTGAGGEVHVQGPSHLGYGADVGYTHIQSADGAGDAPLVGEQTTSAWWRTGAYVEMDTRQSPGYTTSGGLYRVALHHYAGLASAPGFARTEVDLRQFVPILHDNWIVALQARADLTASSDGADVPFFMLPSIGGRETLPGFENYRFTDRNALLLRGELRWTPSPVVDMALFLDTGTVADTVRALDLGTLQHSWGLGARLHGSSVTALRLQVARSPEGWRYNIAQGISF